MHTHTQHTHPTHARMHTHTQIGLKTLHDPNQGSRVKASYYISQCCVLPAPLLVAIKIKFRKWIYISIQNQGSISKQSLDSKFKRSFKVDGEVKWLKWTDESTMQKNPGSVTPSLSTTATNMPLRGKLQRNTAATTAFKPCWISVIALERIQPHVTSTR